MRKKGFLTIGYGNMYINNFIETLKTHRVNCIVDVRTRPYSKYNKPFNKEELRARLNEENITYFWMGKKLGERYDKIRFCDENGIVDYEKIAESDNFKEGLKELEKLFTKYNVCVMCSKQEPMKCHRFLLISRALKQYNIFHIMPNNTLISNSCLEENMFKNYGFLNQLSLFEEENTETLEDKAYRMQSKKFAYVSQKVKELLENGITEDIPDKVKIFCIGTEGKTAEEFFNLLKEYKVKRIIDIRKETDSTTAHFAVFPDIAYHLRNLEITYECIKKLTPGEGIANGYDKNNFSKMLKKYAAQLDSSNVIESIVLDDDLDGICFLGEQEDYKKCYRQIILKKIRSRCPNVIVRHLR